MTEYFAGIAMLALALLGIFGLEAAERQGIIDRCPAGTDRAACFAAADAAKAAAEAEKKAAAAEREQTEKQNVERLERTPYAELDSEGRAAKAMNQYYVPLFKLVIAMCLFTMLAGFAVRGFRWVP